MNVLLIGERANEDHWRPHTHVEPRSLERVKLMLSLGAFKPRRGSERSTAWRLEQCGIRWDASLNLLYPDRDAKWDAYEAAEVAAAVRKELFPKIKIAVLAGKRVQDAFEQALILYGACGTWPDSPLVIKAPHPSGVCRAWNDPTTVVKVSTAWQYACERSREIL